MKIALLILLYLHLIFVSNYSRTKTQFINGNEVKWQAQESNLIINQGEEQFYDENNLNSNNIDGSEKFSPEPRIKLSSNLFVPNNIIKERNFLNIRKSPHEDHFVNNFADKDRIESVWSLTSYSQILASILINGNVMFHNLTSSEG